MSRNQESQSESGTQVSQSASDILKEIGDHCSSCGHGGDLVEHLIASFQCRQAYVKNYLTEEEVDGRKSMFDLCIVLNLCARVGCALHSLPLHCTVCRTVGLHLHLPWAPSEDKRRMS